ncbi:MAG: T9SS type A sorting domain-containing protein [Bacteroidales bacterium]|nr:T9SS type A sorting domain-containing protein [Bacteroidales bacterium]
MEASNQSDSIADALTSLVDGGSTELLTFDVATSTPPQAMQVRDELLTESPYLSDTVMKTSIGKEDVLDNTMIRDVLVANPHAAKSDEIINMLENRVNPNKGDSLLPANADSLNWLFNYHATISTQYDKAGWLHAMGEFTQAKDVLNTIPASFNLNAAQSSTNDAYLDFYELSEAIHSDTTSVFRVDSTTASSLQAITAVNNDLPGVYARNILLAKGKISYQEPVILPDTGLKQAKKTKYRGGKESGKTQVISVFPNPARDYFVVRIDLPESFVNGIIKLYDGNGKVLQSFDFFNQKDQIIIPATNLNSGLYLLELYINGSKISSAKITVVR